MKIFVTGGAGFIGSHLVDKLVVLNHEIIVFDNLFRGKVENIESHIKSGKIRFVEGDIRDVNSVIKESEGCDIVFHLAAQSNVMGSITDIDYSFQTNVVGTYNVLQAAHKNGIKRFIFSSSRESYGEAKSVPVKEDHVLDSKNSYGASKVAGEKYCQVFQNMYNMEIVILRFANVYGTRDFARVIPIFIDNVLKNKNINIFGGKQVIDFISVETICEVLIDCITNSLVLKGPTNVGSGRGMTLFELAERVKNLIPTQSEINVEPARSEEVVRFVASLERFKQVFDINIDEDPLINLFKVAEFSEKKQ
ncbi:MAG: NAD-dependent epimerase/dehydratase family protein [Calditrichaeota bacterium]|nr:MAG: NAD-dependent epimerase/dehydratase family protein [Calditrichota bacterium]MBL1204483.1 NAD-dependent epimerase/dehydratase family protein [Calditrichota bacterium]NOG44312.1 NAD-dependent epimerase/dehydratase family protein [Calditrichota bacterium]